MVLSSARSGGAGYSGGFTKLYLSQRNFPDFAKYKEPAILSCRTLKDDLRTKTAGSLFLGSSIPGKGQNHLPVSLQPYKGYLNIAKDNLNTTKDNLNIAKDNLNTTKGNLNTGLKDGPQTCG